MGAVTLFTVLSPYILPVVQNRNLWAAVSLMAILLFTSGHMFNHIRKVPYVVGDGKGGISYFAGGFSNQFGMETQVVAAICKWPHHSFYGFRIPYSLAKFLVLTRPFCQDAVLSFAIIALAMRVPRMRDVKSQQIAVVIWGAVLLSMYSFLLSVFKAKNGGYPFFLPPF